MNIVNSDRWQLESHWFDSTRLLVSLGDMVICGLLHLWDKSCQLLLSIQNAKHPKRAKLILWTSQIARINILQAGNVKSLHTEICLMCQEAVIVWTCLKCI